MRQPRLVIGPHIIDETSDCFVIAEIGHNHQGSVETCKQLFKAAKEAGAHAVKLQKRDNRSLFTQAFYDAPYNSENAYGPTYGLHREALEFDEAQYRELKAYAESLDIVFFATAFDFKSADFLEALDMPCYKIASGDITNIPLIQHVARFGKPVIVSTGAATMEDVARVYEAVMPINPQLAILQCTATYPTEPEVLDLRVIETYQRAFPDIIVGLSDHFSGIAMGPVSYVLGARIIEKHFTLNRAMRGTDHVFSLEPAGLRKMVRDLKRTRVALGDGTKTMRDAERIARQKMGKSIVAAHPLEAGQLLTQGDLAFKTPGTGMPPYMADQLYGKMLTVSLAQDEALSLDHIDQTLAHPDAEPRTAVASASRSGL